jgi:hypothetical protein
MHALSTAPVHSFSPGYVRCLHCRRILSCANVPVPVHSSHSGRTLHAFCALFSQGYVHFVWYTGAHLGRRRPVAKKRVASAVCV